MTQSLYPDVNYDKDIIPALQEIARLRATEDIGDFTNLPNRFVSGRSTFRIPTNENDVLPTDTKGDITNDGTYKYELLEVSAGILKWIRYPLGSGFSGVTVNLNPVLNGAFDVWQRATAFVNPANNVYTADRWVIRKANGAGTAPSVNVDRNTVNALGGAKYCSQLGITAVGTGGAGRFWRYSSTLEEFEKFKGNTITFSVFLASSLIINFTGASISIFDGITTTTTAITQLTTVPVRYAVSAAIAAGATELTIQIRLAEDAGTISGTGNVFVNKAAINFGSSVTDFPLTNAADQEFLCRRYYRKLNADNGQVIISNGIWDVTAGIRTLRGTLLLNPPMRVSPAATFSAAANYAHSLRTTTVTVTAISVLAGSTNADIDRLTINSQHTTATGAVGEIAQLISQVNGTSIILDSEIP